MNEVSRFFLLGYDAFADKQTQLRIPPYPCDGDAVLRDAWYKGYNAAQEQHEAGRKLLCTLALR